MTPQEQQLASYLDGKFFGFDKGDHGIVIDLNARAPEPEPEPSGDPVIVYSIYEPPMVKSPVYLTRYAILRLILNAVSDVTRVGIAQLQGRSREYRITNARQCFCYVARKHTKHSLPEIGRAIDRDYTTVLHAQQKLTADPFGAGLHVPEIVRVMLEMIKAQSPQKGA